ncbi:MAG: CsgG/HfaB family protein [Candidatus Eisenbacteria bacterium]
MKRTLIARLALLATLTTVFSLPASADESSWRPFLQGKNGEAPFPEDPKGLKDKEWLQVGYTPYTGFKPRLAVVMSEEKQSAPGQYSSELAQVIASIYGQEAQGTNPLNHIEDMVRQALGNTHRFTMLERTTAQDDVIAEQDLGASGRVDRKSAPAIGKLKGADYIVKATVIELNPQKESKDIGVLGGMLGTRGLGIGSVGISGKVAFCRLNVRLVDATTGVVLEGADLTVDGTSSASGLNLGLGGLGGVGGNLVGGVGGLTKKKAASISDAMSACANKGAYFGARNLEQVPWSGSVADASGGRVMINAGANIGLKAGLELEVLSKGEEVKDPDSGESLGFQTSALGRVRIADVQEKFSTCEIVQGCQGVKRGDVVKLDPRKH